MKTRVGKVMLIENSPLKIGDNIYVKRFGEEVEINKVRVDNMRATFVYDVLHNGREKAFFLNEVESDKLK